MNNTSNVINIEYSIKYFYREGCPHCQNFNEFLTNSQSLTIEKTVEYIKNIRFERIENNNAEQSFNELKFDNNDKAKLDGYPTVFFLKNKIVQTEYTMIGMSEKNAKKFLSICEQIKAKTSHSLNNNNNSSGAGSVCGQ